MHPQMKDVKLNPEDVDNLGQAILSLTEELWVLKDRQRVLEATLEKAGVVDKGAVDQHQPDQTLTDLLQQERQQLVENVLSALRKSSN